MIYLFDVHANIAPQTFRMSSTTVNCVPSSIKYLLRCYSVLECYVSKNFDGVYIGIPDECRESVHDEIEMLAYL